MNEILAITLRVAQACEQLGLPYLVGGSLASSLHGIPRATQDVDFVIAISQRDVERFVGVLRDDFYLDEGAIRDAVTRQASARQHHVVGLDVAMDDPALVGVGEGVNHLAQNAQGFPDW